MSKESLNCEIVSAKSSEMNILVPQEDDDYVSDVTNNYFHFSSLLHVLYKLIEQYLCVICCESELELALLQLFIISNITLLSLEKLNL